MAVMTMAGEVLANGADWGPGGWWPIFPLLWLLVLGVVIFVLVRGRRGGDRWHHGQSAEGVLAERYARGEIAEEEYRERLEVLKGSR
ncbi:MAG: SHOCT domain-containing protein [Actinomycetota bacterium]